MSLVRVQKIVNKPVSFTVNEIIPNVFHIVFKNQQDLTSTLLRFQEYYESPKFKNKVFSIKEFVVWYKTTRKNRFTYFSDWAGFNFPSTVFTPFIKNRFNPLTAKETEILKQFKNKKGKFYLIATFEDTNKENLKETLKHELAHSLYYLNPSYKKAVNKLLKKENLKPIFSFLKNLGYHESVFLDESHAYLLTDVDLLKKSKVNTKSYQKIINNLNKLFEQKINS